MKRLLYLFALLLTTLISQAQTTQYLGSPTTTVETRGVHKVDSALLIPADTLVSAATGATAIKNGLHYTKGSSGHWYLTNFPNLSSNVNLFPQSNGSTLVWGDPRQLDTFYVVISGQSNAIGNAQDIGDTASDYRVLVFDTVTRVFKVAHAGSSPFQTVSPAGNSLNGGFYFARKLARTTGKYVKLIVDGIGGTSIIAWFNTTSRTSRTDTLLNRIAASGIPRIDYFIWEQGESDPTMSATQWSNAFDSIRFTVRRQSYGGPNPTTRWAIVGMPDTLSGAQPGYQGQEPTMVAYGYGSDPWVGYATTHIMPGADTVHVNPFPQNNVHFNNEGYQKLGEERIWSCMMSLPMRDIERNNAGGIIPGATITPGLINVVFKSYAGGGATYDGITIQNLASNGRSGVHLLDSAGGSLTKGYLGLAGPGGSYLQPNSVVLSSETNSNVEIDRNLVLQNRYTAAGDSLFVQFIYAPTGGQAMKLTGTSATGGEAIQYVGPGGSDFGNVGMNNSSATTLPGWYQFYHSNYYLWHTDAGTVIGNGASTSFPTAPRATLDDNGSLALEVDSFSATGSLGAITHCVAWFKTGATNDSCFLPGTSATKKGLGYWVMKTDAGAGTVTVYDATSGHTINGVASILLANQYDMVYVQCTGGNNWYAKFYPGNSMRYIHSVFTPTTGGTVTLVVNQYNIINPSGTLATLTIALPSSPNNNDVVHMKFTQTITTITYSGGTVVGAPTTMASGSSLVLTYDSATSTWY